MPIYEFECSDCKYKFEKLVFVNDDEKPPCPTCGSINVRRVMSAASVQSGKGAFGANPFAASSCSPSGG